MKCHDVSNNMVSDVYVVLVSVLRCHNIADDSYQIAHRKERYVSRAEGLFEMSCETYFWKSYKLRSHCVMS